MRKNKKKKKNENLLISIQRSQPSRFLIFCGKVEHDDISFIFRSGERHRDDGDLNWQEICSGRRSTLKQKRRSRWRAWRSRFAK